MNTTPLESQEQTALFDWAEYQKNTMPELALMFHIPNGGSRNKIEAARLKRQGVKKGVSDVFLSCPKGGYHGLYIEMKRQKGGVLTKEQSDWLELVAKYGYKVAVCYGAEAAIKEITDYLKGESA